MKTIKIYLSLIEPVLLNHINGEPRRFIKILKEDKSQSEDSFIQKICGERKIEYYRGLKSRILKILQTFALMSSLQEANPVKKKYDSCQKKFLLGQKFMTKGERVEGIRLIKSAWKLATDYDFVHLGSELSSLLYHHHVYHAPNGKKANFYSKQVELFLNNYIAEKKAEDCLFRVIRQSTKATQPEIIYEAILEIAKHKGTSVKYYVYKGTVEVMYGFNIGDYYAVIRTCKQILKFIKNKKGTNISHYQFFFSKMAIAQMSMEEYKKAKVNFEKAILYAPSKSYNAYVLNYYKTLNAIRASQYQIAYELYQQNKRCKIPALREQFAIIEAYLCFLHHSQGLQLVKKFRIGKYLNETFKAQTDKRGDNINILIAELLIYFARDRDKFIDRVDAIRNYSYRYLQGKETQRAKYFIKILCLMPSVNFHAEALKRKAKKYIDYLENHPVSMGSNFAIEIIPFERLLKMIMKNLAQKVA